MSLLDTASLLLTPNAYKEGKLYSVIPSDGSGDMSVTRATTATRVNSAGLVELVPYNLVTYSEQFDNADWTKNNISITANTTTAPNGTTTADKLIPSTSLATHRITQNINTLGICTASFYVKASGYKKIGLQNNVVGGGQYFTAEQEKNYNTAMSGIALEMAYVLNGGYQPDGQTVNKIEGLLAVTPNDTVGNAAYKFSDVAAKLKAGIEYTPTYTELQKKAKEDLMKKLDRYATPEIVYERQYGIAPKPDTRVRTTPRGATVSNWDK